MPKSRPAFNYDLIEKAADLTDCLTTDLFTVTKAPSTSLQLDWPPWSRAWSQAFFGKLNPSRLRYPLALRSKEMLPKWAMDFGHLLEFLDKHPCAAESNFHDGSQHSSGLARTLIKPISAFAYKELCRRVPAGCRKRFSPEAQRELVEWLEERLTNAVKSCVELHFRAFAAVARCSRKTCSIERLIGEYARPCGHRLLQVIRANPPLAKIVIILVDHWVDAVSELLERLSSDLQLLTKSFRIRNQNAKVTRVRMGLSDPKAGGRSVVELRFTGGSTIIYKPRDVVGEVDWFSFLEWANSGGCMPSFRILRALSCDGYGWVEGVLTSPCYSRDEVREFYRRSGGLLCFMHLTGTSDCHQENIIAVGAHPLLIDAETLGNFINADGQTKDRLTDATVFRTGYLPIPANFGPLSAEYSWSALEPSVERSRTKTHLPRFRGRFQSSRNFAQEIIEGFSSTMKFLLSNRTDPEFRRQMSRITTQHPRRMIYRNTRTYMSIIEASMHPVVMCSGIARSAKLVTSLWGDAIDPKIARQEFLALSNLDIPFFSRSASSFPILLATREAQADESVATLSAQLPLLNCALFDTRQSFNARC
jgi:hypothetical protein